MRILGTAIRMVLMAPAGSWAQVMEYEGQAPFVFAADFGDAPRVGRPTRIWVTFAGMQFDMATMGIARLLLSSGLSLVSGDTLRQGWPAGRGNRWPLVVLARRPVDLEVTGTVRIKWPGRDRVDLRVEKSRETRLETIRGGQRYYGGGKPSARLDLAYRAAIPSW